MILSLALRYQKQIALFLLSISFVQLTIAERVAFYRRGPWINISSHNTYGAVHDIFSLPTFREGRGEAIRRPLNRPVIASDKASANRPFIGGPTQPESQSFTSVNSNNMVDLFSGDFSYNIPLLDVGG